MSTYRVIQRATPPASSPGYDDSQYAAVGHVLRFPEGAVDLGNGYWHVEPRYLLDPVNDTLVADEINGKTWDSFPGKAPLHSARVMRARAYRYADTKKSLRAQVALDESVTVGKGVPQSGNSSSKPVNAGKGLDALARAKELHAADPDAVLSVSVTMGDVADGDVVDSDLIPPHHWA